MRLVTQPAIVAAVLSLPVLPCRLAAQGGPGGWAGGLRVQLQTQIPVFRRFPLLEPGGRLGLRTMPELVALRWRAETDSAVAVVRADLRAIRLLTNLVSLGAQTARQRRTFAIAAPPVRDNRAVNPLQAVANVADLGIQLRSTVELRLDRLRNENCSAFDFGTLVSGCEAGFPAPSLDQQFRVSAGGVVSQRVNINVDFDSEREFDSNNDIRVWYQGLDDEIIRRVEVGNVRFSAPSSRFITSSIGGNAFGLKADAQVGPIDLTTVFAQQRGSSVRSRVFTVGERNTQPVDREIRDVDWETGRFFSVVDPRLIPSYPDVNMLDLALVDLPDALRLAQVRVYRLRAQTSGGLSNPNLGGIDAVAVRRDSPQRVGPFPWELLVEGRDYYIDPSGLWFAMASRVGDGDFLAVSYVTVAGDTVGTFPAVTEDLDTLELIHEPQRGPEVPTFYHELRNAYRIGGSDVQRNSIEMTILVNEGERPLDGQGTYLSRLRLSQANDPNSLDTFNRIFPRTFDPNGGLPVRDLFVIFPHFTPFADSTRLQQGERNDSIYRTPTFLRITQGPPSTLRMRLHVEAQAAGNRSSLTLGALQIQPGSEVISIGNRPLRRGVHYEISYNDGVVTFINPDSLFPQQSQVRVEFEEDQQFDLGSKSLVGFAASYNFGTVGRINAVGLLQSEKTQLLRPVLGFEPEATFVGGLSSNLEFRVDAISRFLDRLPLIETQVPSRLVLNGEIATSRPNPNLAGAAWVEDFEGAGSSTFSLLLTENFFQVGSAPSSGRGLDPRYLSPSGNFEPDDAVPLVWQNLIQAGASVLSFEPQNIDSTLVFVGSARETETVLWMTISPDTVGGAPDPLTGRPRWSRPHIPGPRWRSISQPLGGSGLGIDMSRVEFLEFWVLEDAERKAMQDGAVLVFDFGTLFEDAVAPAPTEFTVSGADTTFTGLQFVGVGRLDTERDSITDVFNAAVDDVGILADLLPAVTDVSAAVVRQDFPMCEAPRGSAVPVFPLGDLAVNCTRFNSFIDTEDLDGDNRLDILVGRTQEDLIRYVFPIGDPQYFVRSGGSIPDTEGRPMVWRLYRIPIRGDSVQVGSPTLRQVRAMRMTVVVPDNGRQERELFFSLARMKLIGAPWLKRSETPIAGIHGARGEPHGEVVASVVSTENRDLGYESPPGLGNQATRAGQSLTFSAEQINERSLRLLARDLRQGERAESFIRFADESDNSFLNYRLLRVWARGRGLGWQENDLEFFIKVGRDENNFYMYRQSVRTDQWEPEIVIDMRRWLELRAVIETRWLEGQAPSGSAQCGGSDSAFVICDGPYVVHVADPGVGPPNLARVSEVAVGMYRGAETVPIDLAELWVDDIRLDDVVNDVGYAGAFDARLSAADIGEVSLAFTNRDDQFRQLGENPSYVGDRSLRLAGMVRVDRLLPRSWGMNIPITFQRNTTSQNPFFLNRSDVLAEGLPELRAPRTEASLLQFALARERRGDSWIARNVLDPLRVTGRLQESEAVALLSEATNSNKQVRVQYNRRTEAKSIRAVPGFIVSIVDALPGFIRNSEFARALRRSRLRWNPVQFNLSSSITNNRSVRSAFRAPVAIAADSLIPPTRSILHMWVNDANVDFRPFTTLSLAASLSSMRDLRDYGDSTTVSRLLQDRSKTLLGTGVGFERQQSFSTRLRVDPVLSTWFFPRIVLNTNYTFNRDPNNANPVREGTDSTGAFRPAESISNLQRREFGTRLDIARLVKNIAGDSSLIGRLLGGINQTNVSLVRERQSTFDRVPFGPSTRFRFALGGFDEFLQQNGLLATSARETKTYTATGGTLLPLGMQLTLNYQQNDVATFAKRGDRHTRVTQTSREWPSFTFRWSYSPRAFVGSVLRGIEASASYRENVSRLAQPSLGAAAGETSGAAERVSESRNVTPTVTLNWRGGIVTTVQFTSSRVDQSGSGSVTQTEQISWTGTLNFSYRIPEAIARLRSPILTSVSYSRSNNGICLIRPGGSECTTVSDGRRNRVNVSMDTGLSSSVRGGATFTYLLTEQRHISSKFSQIIFSIFVQINFLAGQIR